MLDDIFRAVTSMIQSITRWSGGLNRAEWLLLLMLVVGIGVVCLRGFGSRSRY